MLEKVQLNAESQVKVSGYVAHPISYPLLSSDNDLVGALINAFQTSYSKLNLELFKFNGDFTSYTHFISTLESTIERLEIDNCIWLLYWIQHCKSKAKSLIQYCVLLDPDVGNTKKAKEIVHENFGKWTLIAWTYIKNLVKGHPIKQDNSNALIQFTHDIECHSTLGHMNYLSDPNCFKNIS